MTTSSTGSSSGSGEPGYLVGLPPPTVGAGQTAAATYTSTNIVKAEREEKGAAADDTFGTFDDFFSYNFAQSSGTTGGINSSLLPPPTTNLALLSASGGPAAATTQTTTSATTPTKASSVFSAYFAPNLAVEAQIILNLVAEQMMKTEYTEALFAIAFISVTIDLAKGMASLAQSAAYATSAKEMNNAAISFAQSGISGAGLLVSAYNYKKATSEVNDSLDDQKTQIDKWENPDDYDTPIEGDPDQQLGVVRQQRQQEIEALEAKSGDNLVAESEDITTNPNSDINRLSHLKNLQSDDDQKLLEAKRGLQQAKLQKDQTINQVYNGKMQTWEAAKNTAIQALQGGQSLNSAVLDLTAGLDNAEINLLQGYFQLSKQQQEKFLSDAREKKTTFGSIIEAVKKIQDEHARALTFTIH